MATSGSQTYSLSGLYVITDAGLQAPEQLCITVEQALQGGARLVQFRNKSGADDLQIAQATQLIQLCNDYNVPLIVNDNIDLAQAINAAGVHLGRNDCNLKDARQLLGSKAIIGISCYNEWSRAAAASEQGADYIAFGSFFVSQTKPAAVAATKDLLQRARLELKIPVVAIGGITPGNAAGLIEAGADMLAVIHGVFAQPDIKSAAQQYADLFRNA